MEESFNEKVNRLVFTLPYNSILALDNELLRNICIKRYEEEQEKLINTYPNFADYFDTAKSLEHNYYNLEQMANEIISDYLFPGDKVIYFPIVESFKASKRHTCALSGAIISPGNYYEQFKALLNNISQNKSYVSTKIRYECGSDFKIPASLHEFEDLCYRIDHSYELDLEEEYTIACEIGGMRFSRIRYKNQKNKK